MIWQMSFAQNLANSGDIALSDDKSTSNVHVFFNNIILEDSIVHIVWENYDESNIKEVILESGNDKYNFTKCAAVVLSKLPDIHLLSYPKEMNYNNTILKSTEHSNIRYMYNDVAGKRDLNKYPKWYRVKMITFSGYTYISQMICTNKSEDSHNSKCSGSIGNDQLSALATGETPDYTFLPQNKAGCSPVGTPPSGFTSTGVTQMFYGDNCCYWVETRYKGYTNLTTPCGGTSTWCCNNVPGASGCTSGYMTDPCCVHTCGEYNQCSCTPWDCCPGDLVYQWVVTESGSVTPPPVPVASATPSSVCVSGNVTLSATGTGTKYWYTGSCGGTFVAVGNSIVVSVSSSTTFYVRAYLTSSTVSCPSTGCGSVTVTVSSPVNQTITGVTPLCAGSSASWSSTTTGGTWTSSSPGVATINSSTGLVTAVSTGTAIITYTVVTGACVNTATKTITVYAPVTQNITGTNPLCVGLSATWGSTTTGGIWSSSNPGVAVIGSSTGVVNGIAAGTSLITYTVTTNGVCVNTATRIITITSPVSQSITGTNPLCISSSATWYGTTPGGAWTSSNPGVATIGATSGLISGVSLGSSVINYSVTTLGGCLNTATRQVIVVNTIPQTITGTNPLCVGNTVTWASTTTGGLWSSSNPGVAIFNAGTGMVTGVSAGTSLVTYAVSSGGCVNTATQTITVLPTNTINPSSGGLQVVNINTPITTTTFITTGATGVAVTGLPPGVTGNWASNMVTISGTPTAYGTYTYTVTTTGGCGPVTATGTIIVTSPNTPTATIGSVMNACPGAPAIVDITLSDFIASLTAFQFTIRYDTNYLHFNSITDWPTGIAGVGILHNYNGSIDALTFAWADIPEVSVNGLLCRLNFTYKAPTSGCHAVVWSDMPTPRLFADEYFNEITVDYVDGMVCGPAPEVITGASLLCAGASAVWTSTTGGGTWTSSDPGIVAVNAVSGVVTGVAAGTAVISYAVTKAGCLITETKSITIEAPVAQNILGTASLCTGSYATWTSTTTGGTWTSSMPAIASIDQYSGLITAVTAGTSVITYSVNTGVCLSTASRILTVSSPVAQTITGSTSICIGSAVNWSSTTPGGNWTSNSTDIATIDPVTGVVIGVAPGTSQIVYSITTGGCINTATKTVTISSSIPQIITGSTLLCEGSTTSWTSTTLGGTWSSASPAIAFVGSSDGVVNALSAGNSVITYSVTTTGGCVNTASQTITIAAPVAQTITGTNSLCVGASSTWTSTTPGGNWSSGAPGVAAIDASTGLVSGVSPGTSIISYSVTTAGGCINTASQTISISDTVFQTISGATPICSGSSAIWTCTTTGGNWTSSDPMVATVDVLSGMITGISGGSSLITYSVSSGGCINIATKVLTITSLVTQHFTGAVQFCEGSALTWASTSPGGTWTSSAPAIATIDAVSGLVTGVSSGTSMIAYSVTINGCINTASQMVTISAPVSQTISGNSLLCIGATTNLAGTTPGGSWKSGNPGIAVVDSVTGLVSGLSPGTSVITYTVSTAGSCVNTATILVTVSATLNASISGGTTPLCYNTNPGTFTASGTGGNGMYSYQWHTAPSTPIANATNSTYNPGILSASVGYYCRITDPCGFDTSNIITIIVYPMLTANISGGNSPICEKSNPGIFTATAGGGTGTYSYQWYRTSSGIINGATNSTYSPGMMSSSNGFYCLVSSVPCGSTSTAVFNVVVIPQVGTPTPITVNGGTEPVCQLMNGNTTTTYHTTATNNTGFHWALSNPLAGTVDSTTGIVTWANGFYGTVNIQVFAYGCGIPSPTVTRTVVVNQNPFAEAGVTTTYTGTPIMIGHAGNGPGTISWNPATGLNNATIAQPLASPSVTTKYTLTINNNGCSSTDTVTVFKGVVTTFNINGKTRYAKKANTGIPIPNPPTYNPAIYDIDNVIVILKSYPAGLELARDTSDETGNFHFGNIANGNYMLSYDKYTVDTMQWGNGVDAIDITILKYNLGIDTIANPSRNFSSKYKKAINVDNNSSINAIDISRIKAKIGSPYLISKNFPKGNWVALDTLVTVAGSDLSVMLNTICYGDYNASSNKYRDSTLNWSMAKSLPENIILSSDDYIVISDLSKIEIPLRLSSKVKDFSALGLELKYQDKDFRLIDVNIPKAANKNGTLKINPTLDEIIADNSDLIVTDENGVIRIVYASTDQFDADANDVLVSLVFSSLRDLGKGEIAFDMYGTGVIGNIYGQEDENAHLLMPKIFKQGNNTISGFDFEGYPNPFSNDVTLIYTIPEDGIVQLKVYNAIGELVAEPVHKFQSAGKYKVSYDGKLLKQGMYTFTINHIGLNSSNCSVLKMIH